MKQPVTSHSAGLKKHLADHRPRFQAPADTQKQLLTGFLQAIQAGEMSPLMNLLAEDVTFWGDGGARSKVRQRVRLAGELQWHTSS